MADVGDVAIQGSQVEANFDRMTEVMRRITERGALPVAVGGDHSVSFPLARGMQPVGEIDVVYLDGHADFLTTSTVPGSAARARCGGSTNFPSCAASRRSAIRNVERDEIDAMRELGVRWATPST